MRLMSPVDALGRAVLRSVRFAAEGLETIGKSVLHLPALWGPLGFYLRRTVMQQIYFTAAQAFWLMLLVGAVLGVLVAFPLLAFGITEPGVQATVMKTALFHQMVPLLSALVVVGRSGTALTAEVAEFHYRGVVESLAVMGIDPDDFILLPRLLGVTGSLVLLTLWANIGAVLGAALFNAWRGTAALSAYLQACARAVAPLDASLTLLMTLACGGAIVLVQTRIGLRARDVVELQRSLPQAFVRSLLWCVGITLLFTLMRP
jgi:phospholipid/cholesterol/gamma-HCH transport system permease protein